MPEDIGKVSSVESMLESALHIMLGRDFMKWSAVMGHLWLTLRTVVVGAGSGT
jgi:hypothetical protein